MLRARCVPGWMRGVVPGVLGVTAGVPFGVADGISLVSPAAPPVRPEPLLKMMRARREPSPASSVSTTPTNLPGATSPMRFDSKSCVSRT